MTGMRVSIGSVLVVAVLFGFVGCGGGPSELTLLQLSRQQEDYNGRLVSAEGVLCTHATPRHYWIEDDDYNRVELEQAGDLPGLVGVRIRVQGEFRYARDRGRRIVVERMERLP